MVSADFFNANPRYAKVMVVHLTSVARATVPDWEVALPRGVASLPSASTAKCGEVYTIAKDRLDALAGTVPNDHMERIDAALGLALSLGR